MNIQINKFTGPLELLLQLIRKEEMDILDIDIHKITDQYLHFIDTHPISNLDSAGNFIKLAATLIYLKSKSLFPSTDTINSEIEEEDTQEELVKGLLRIQNLQHVAQKLQQNSLIGRDVWARGEMSPSSQDYTSDNENIKQQPILKLLKCYHKIMTKMPILQKPQLPILPLLSDYIRTIHEKLTMNTTFKMSSLIQKNQTNSGSQTLITFLAFLELGRLGIITLSQLIPFADIDIKIIKTFQEKDFGFIKEVSHSFKLTMKEKNT